MKAMVLKEYNSPLVYEEVPRPSPKRTEIVLKVHACGMCFTDANDALDGVRTQKVTGRTVLVMDQ
jgi:D-arabinose 1-dehydrogenase-like Zn-dependent alcohol dehydrogenase